MACKGVDVVLSRLEAMLTAATADPGQAEMYTAMDDLMTVVNAVAACSSQHSSLDDVVRIRLLLQVGVDLCLQFMHCMHVACNIIACRLLPHHASRCRLLMPVPVHC